MPATAAATLKAGLRACAFLVFVPALAGAQTAAAAQVLLLQVKEHNALVLEETGDSGGTRWTTAAPESLTTVVALIWTTNGNAKKITVTALPPSEGLALRVHDRTGPEDGAQKDRVDLSTPGGHELATGLARSSGRWLLAYALKAKKAESRITFTIIDG